MTPDQAFVKCPHCFGENVDPRGDNWYCRDCDITFEAAAVQLPEPEKPAPKRPPRPPK